MSLDIAVDADRLKSVQDVLQLLEDSFQVDFIPGIFKKLDEKLLVERAAFRTNTLAQRYELDVYFGLKGPEASARSPFLKVGMHITIQSEVAARGRRPARYDGTLEVPLTDEAITHVPFALYLRRAARGALTTPPSE
ncbi:hypothetical protein SAMN05443572_112147 [Myxococcus fulvus]|uniref:Uncharacterized protein n=1 Tax=Myxococcus fulvus TaxID=33 RepID=A0A511TB34_MYXFU|nr:hypothetical protein [Myxococcus fulvus]GEN10803.1 hypothetical protein MFU01_58400 [Myxococcus fulvus]SEU37566.1 hypothetical protein SAMN05443572_112147 [Myxococcus fulvus]